MSAPTPPVTRQEERERLAKMADERASQIEGAVHRVARHMNLTPEEQASERALFQVWEGGSTSMREAADWRTIAAILREPAVPVGEQHVGWIVANDMEGEEWIGPEFYRIHEKELADERIAFAEWKRLVPVYVHPNPESR